MPRRVPVRRLLVAMIPVLAVLVSVGDLVLAGRRATAVAWTNLQNPRASSGLRLIDLVHPPANSGTAYDLNFRTPPGLPSGARFQIRLASEGRTRLLAVRPGAPVPSWAHAAGEVLSGRARLLVVADRGWVDLGEAPAAGSVFAVQIYGLLPGRYGFAELNEETTRENVQLDLRRADAPSLPVVRTVAVGRVVVARPVSPREMLTRLFFFVASSRVLFVAALVSCALLVSGCVLLALARTTGAVACLVCAATLLHAVLLPPLQGADETSHEATVEAQVFRGTMPTPFDAYPDSFSRLAEALDQDRVQFQTEETLPITTAEQRARLRTVLLSHLGSEARVAGAPPPSAGLQPSDARAPLFFRLFVPLAPALRSLSILDRTSAYRLVASACGLAFILLGLAVLRAARLKETVVALYGCVALFPYSVAVVASCSNYAPAIGLGALLGASACAAVLAETPRARARFVALFVGASVVGVFLWTDFVFVVALAGGAAVVAGLMRAARWSGASPRAARWVGLAAVAVPATVAIFGAVRAAYSGTIAVTLPRELAKQTSRSVALMAAACALPLIVAAAAAVGVQALSRRAETSQRRALRASSWALGALLLIGFLASRWTAVPYEVERLSFPKLAGAHLEAFLSNNFSWDQDRLSWKFTWGAFGWHDAFYPDWLYALARWSCVALLIALPFLASGFVVRRPKAAASLLLVCGAALSCAVATETLRYLAPGNPYGRFLLPLVPLAALPLLTMIATEGRERWGRLAFTLLAALHVWTAVALLGRRYAFGS